MATIQGPKIQFSISELFDFQYDQDGGITGVSLKQQAATFFNSVQQITFNLSRSGPTGSRPTANLDGRWIGMPYFDTTLGKPIFLKTASSNAWVLADGTAA